MLISITTKMERQTKKNKKKKTAVTSHRMKTKEIRYQKKSNQKEQPPTKPPLTSILVASRTSQNQGTSLTTTHL